MRRDHARVDDFARDRRGHLQGDERPHEVRIAATATATLSRSARRGDRRGHRVRRVVKLVGEAKRQRGATTRPTITSPALMGRPPAARRRWRSAL